MSVGRRVLMTLVGVTVLLAYAAAAGVVVLLFAAAFAADVSLATVLAGVAAATVVVGYLSYRYGTARILAELNAVPLGVRDAPGAYQRLDRLTSDMNVEPPRLFVARMPAPNAISLGGPNGGAVVFDESLFRFLDGDEFEGVLAHELAHIESRDSLVQTLAYSVTRTVVAGVALVLLPVALLARGVSRLVAWASGRPSRDGLALNERVGSVVVFVFVVFVVLVRTHSRKREFAADERAVEVTGKPLELASALRKIQRASESRGFFASFSRRRDSDDETHWLSSHPALAERIERLREYAASDGWHRISVR